MNLRQLRYIDEIARRDLNISAVAAALHTSQSGISKQLQLFEAELGSELFVRSRNRLSAITPVGHRIIAIARNIIAEVASIEATSRDLVAESGGPLVIATTHTQARYVLPEILKSFIARFPRVTLTLRHGDPAQIAALVRAGEADIGVTTDTPGPRRDLLIVPCRRFGRIVVTPRGHELLRCGRLTLKAIAQYPLVTYEPAFTGRTQVMKAFAREGLQPTIVLSAIDADVIKTCVEHGLGIAVLSEVTYDRERDTGLGAIPAGHLFEASNSHVVLHRQRQLRQYAYDFVELCAPRWNGAVRARLRSQGGKRTR